MTDFLDFSQFKHGREPEYFYRVWELVTTFGKDEGKNEPFSHTEEFKGDDLLKCKEQAEKYYLERLEGLEQGKYFLPFASPQNFQFGKNAAFSITVALVEFYSEDDQYEHITFGDEESVMAESREIEAEVIANQLKKRHK